MPLTYDIAVEKLLALGHELHLTPSAKFDLAHMRVLLDALGHPERRFASVLIAGTNGKGSTAATLASILDCARHLVLPVITLSYAQLAIFARFSKSALTEVIRQDFITTARAKGAAPRLVLWRHAFRNALMPLITLLGLTIPYLISGSVIVEQIFQWDGIGHLFFASVSKRDYPTVLGLTVISAMITLLANLAADLMYAAADPRVRLEGGGRR